MASERLTPVMQLMVNEGLLELPTPTALAKRRSQRFLREIFDQTLFTIQSYPYENHVQDPPGDAFRVTLGPTLDPFSGAGKCEELRCRISTAQRFARSIPLYADQAIVPDPITAVLFPEEEPTVGRLAEQLHTRLGVLKTLMPLVDTGVVRFAASAHAVCSHCKAEQDRLTERGLEYCHQLVATSGLGIEVARRRDGKGRITLTCPTLFGTGPHELVASFDVAKERTKRFLKYFGHRAKRAQLSRADSEAVQRYIAVIAASNVGHVMFHMASSAMSRSAFASGSRLETAFLASLEGTAPPAPEIENWEALRSIELPWVRDLSVDQVVQLRQDTGPALEHLRAALAACINHPDHTNATVEAFVGDLRRQAVEVKNGLSNYNKFGGGRAGLALGLDLWPSS
jgi:hypothetical protein